MCFFHIPIPNPLAYNTSDICRLVPRFFVFHVHIQHDPKQPKKTRCFRIKPATLQTRDVFHVEVQFFDIAGDAVILVGDFNANSASLTIQVAMSSRGCMEYYLEVLLKPISTCSHP